MLTLARAHLIQLKKKNPNLTEFVFNFSIHAKRTIKNAVSHNSIGSFETVQFLIIILRTVSTKEIMGVQVLYTIK